MGVKGDFARLSKLAHAFASAKAEQPQITKSCAAASVRLNRADFAGRHSPDGESWPDGRWYHGLFRKGKLAGGFRATSSPTTFGVRNVARYAWYHQHGAVLRAPIVGSKGKLPRARRVSFRRRVKAGIRSGPQRQVRFQGPARKGHARGILPARPILATGGIPGAWQPLLDRIVLDHYRKLLRA